jgi:hypothetical protein
MKPAASVLETNANVVRMDDHVQQGPCRVWPSDSASFSTSRVSALRHNFHEHPLMRLSSLAQLAKNLFPTKQCRFIAPGTRVSSDFNHADASYDGRTIDEVFRRIEEPGSWLALYNVETDPTYRGFLAEVASSARSLVDREQPGMFNVGGFIFISAPPSVTPFHIDRENNFWLQVAGRKTLNVWDHTDRVTVSGKDVEDFVLFGSLKNVKLRDGLAERSHEFDVGVGDGVYFPSTSPHMTRTDAAWVKPGDGVSISIGVVFYTDVTRRHAHIHACNHALRRFGLDPSLPGASPIGDAIKYPLGRAVVRAMRARGYEPRVGF